MTEKEKLIQMILNNENIVKYKKIEKIINKDIIIRQKIEKLKHLQKKLVNAKEFRQQEKINYLQHDYQALLNEIKEYPLMSEYLSLQEEIDEMLQTIKIIFEQGLDKEL